MKDLLNCSVKRKSHHVPYDDVFEYVAVVVRARRHFHCLRPALHIIQEHVKIKKLFIDDSYKLSLLHLYLMNMPSFFPLSHNSLPNSHLWKTFKVFLWISVIPQLFNCRANLKTVKTSQIVKTKQIGPRKTPPACVHMCAVHLVTALRRIHMIRDE